MARVGRPKKMDQRKPVTVYLDSDEKAHYQAIADREGTSISVVCRRVLRKDMRK